GAMADIHAWAPGLVVKLFKAGVPRQVGAHEARVTRAVFAAGGPAPEVLGEVTLDGRFGFVLPRLDGPTLLQTLVARAMTLEQAGAVLATGYMSVHRTRPPRDLLSLRDWFDAAVRGAGGRVPEHIAAGVLALAERLPAGDGLCHADLHAGNVILTVEGPRLIDWAATVRAPAAYDLGRCHLSLTELLPAGADAERAGALNAVVQDEYARLSGTSPAALPAAMAPYLPIIRAIALTDRAISPSRRAQLIQSIEATLGQDD